MSYGVAAIGLGESDTRVLTPEGGEHGLLEEITGRAWGRLYLARPILRAIEGSEGTT